MDSARYERVSVLTNEHGILLWQTNRFTLLAHGLNYPDPVTGQWRESEELVEAHPDGAVARRGAYQTIFSADVASDTVFDIQTPDRKRLRGGPRLLFLSDPTTGKSITLGTIKSSQGEILPPNEVLYRSCFEGIEADVVYVWKKGGLSQNVLLREALGLPEGWSQDSRIEVVTEFVEAPQPDVRAQVVKAEGLPDLVDAGFIVFGWMAALPGVAYAVEGGANLTGPAGVEGGSVPVAKEWIPAQGAVGALLIESVSYRESGEYLKDLPRLEARVEPRDLVVGERSVALAGVRKGATAERLEARNRTQRPDPMQLAAAGAASRAGYLIDVELGGTATDRTFQAHGGSEGTYSICTNYTVTGSATFHDGAIIKYANNAYLQLSGSVSAPTNGLVQLTSIHDDSVGAKIATGNCTSNGDPFSAGQTALHALRIYGPPSSTTLRNFRICFAKTGVNYYSSLSHTMERMRFEHGQTAVSAYAASVTISNVVQCNTYALTSNQGGGASFSMTNVSTDCAFYVAPAGSDNNLGTLSSPWQTLAQAKKVAGPKVTVVLRGGSDVNNPLTYAEDINGDWYGGLSWANASVLRGHAADVARPVIKPSLSAPGLRVVALTSSGTSRPGYLGLIPAEKQSYTILERLVLDGTLLVQNNPGCSAQQPTLCDYEAVKITDGAHHVRLSNCEIRNAGNHGINLNNGELATGNCEFLKLHIHDFGIGNPLDTPPSFRHAIYLSNSDNLVDQCRIAKGPGAAVHIYENRAYNNNNTVRNCYFDECSSDPGAASVYLSAGTGHKFYNNIVRRSRGHAVRLSIGVANTLVAFNTIVDNLGCAALYVDDDKGAGCQILNNIVARNTGTGILYKPNTNAITFDYNLARDNGLPNEDCSSTGCVSSSNYTDQGNNSTFQSPPLHNLGVDQCPGTVEPFENAAGLDFRPRLANPVSPALSAGTSITGLNQGYSGPNPADPTQYATPLPRPTPAGSNPDIGAYER